MKKVAKKLEKMGQGGDTILAHIMQKTLQRIELVKFSLGRYIGGVRYFFCTEVAKVAVLSAASDRCSPLVAPLVKGHAKDSRFAIASCASLILQVFAARCFAQIRQSVIRPDAVDVVDIGSRPHSSHVQPSKAVGGVYLATDAESDVAVLIQTPRAIANLSRAGTCQPGKHSRLRAIAHKLAQALGRYNFFSHDVAFLRWDQRPACVTTACGLRYFNGV